MDLSTNPVNRIANRDARPREPVRLALVPPRVFLRAVPGEFPRLADGLELGETSFIEAPAEIIDWG